MIDCQYIITSKIVIVFSIIYIIYVNEYQIRINCLHNFYNNLLFKKNKIFNSTSFLWCFSEYVLKKKIYKVLLYKIITLLEGCILKPVMYNITIIEFSILLFANLCNSFLHLIIV